jgi:outer membrane lipopolysaccharide assembly protein LptE/RlpB
MRKACAVLLAGLTAVGAGCGYHVAGRATHLPESVKTIAVPALENRSTQYRIEQRLTEALVHELLAQGRYRVVANPAAADATLRGTITLVETSPLVFDTPTGRATMMLVTLRCSVRLEQNDTKAVLFRSDNLLFRNEYELSTDVASFFGEQDPALQRLARDFAKQVVSAVLEGF